MVDVSKHLHTVLTVNKLAFSAGLPERNPHVFVGVGVVVAHDLLDGLGGLSSVVEWDSGNIVVQDVGLDDVVEEEPTGETELSVDGGSGTSGEVPFGVFVVRQSGVGVLQEGDENKPVVGENVRQEPVDEAVEVAEMLDPLVNNKGLGQDTQIRQDDEPEVPLLEDWRHWVEVRGVELLKEGALQFLVRLTGDISQEVPEPTTELLNKQILQGDDWSVLGDLLQGNGTLAGNKLFLGLWNENHVSGQMAGGLVVLTVGVLPGEVRDHQVGVQDPADGVVDPAVVGEGLMATLMSHNPDTSHRQGQHDGVREPRDASEIVVGDHRDDGVGDVHHCADHRDVSEDVVERRAESSLVAVLRNGLQDLLDGVVRSGELVTMEGLALQVGGHLLGSGCGSGRHA